VHDEAARSTGNRAGILRCNARHWHRQRTNGPARREADGATLFRQQCGTCHTESRTSPARPVALQVVGRPAGRADGFHYSPSFAKADFVWDDARLDAWLTNPQQIIPGTVMVYRQAKPETRAAIIAYLKELN
jgi:cytochrome c